MENYNNRRRQIGHLAWIILLIALFSMSADAQDRMPPIPDDEMTEAQKEAAAEFRAERGEPGGPWAVSYTHLTLPTILLV